MSQHEWIIWVHNTVRRAVWNTRGPLDQHMVHSKCLPIELKILVKSFGGLKSPLIAMNYPESNWMDPTMDLVPMVWKLPHLAEMPQRPQNSLLHNELIWVNINGSSGYIPLLEDLEYTTRPTHAAFQMFTISFKDPSKVLCWSLLSFNNHELSRVNMNGFC